MRRTWKQPGETRLFTYDFSELLAGRTIANVLGAPLSVARTGLTTLNVVGVPIQTDNEIQVEWGGGTDGVTYLTTVKVRDSQGQDHEMEGEIVVADVQFVLPTGVVTPYITGEEYADRFGFEETVRLTDQDRKGVIDVARLKAALADATEYADGFMAVRYPLPFAPAPTMLKGIVAALAREKLHSQRPLPQVTAEADRARATLEKINAGKISLVAETGAVVEPASAATYPLWGGTKEGEVFNSETLADF